MIFWSWTDLAFHRFSGIPHHSGRWLVSRRRIFPPERRCIFCRRVALPPWPTATFCIFMWVPGTTLLGSGIFCGPFSFRIRGGQDLSCFFSSFPKQQQSETWRRSVQPGRPFWVSWVIFQGHRFTIVVWGGLLFAAGTSSSGESYSLWGLLFPSRGAKQPPSGTHFPRLRSIVFTGLLWPQSPFFGPGQEGLPPDLTL